jgi:monoamine oxidase
MYVADQDKNALEVNIRLWERDCFGGHRIIDENLIGLHYLSVMHKEVKEGVLNQ